MNLAVGEDKWEVRFDRRQVLIPHKPFHRCVYFLCSRANMGFRAEQHANSPLLQITSFMPYSVKHEPMSHLRFYVQKFPITSV